MNTWKFICERFPLKATIPMTAILAFAPLSLNWVGIVDALMIWATIFISLLALRMADDLVSIEVDKIKSPHRGLPSGTINASVLRYVLFSMLAIVLMGNIFKGSMLTILILICYYMLYYRFEKIIPFWIKPFLVNLLFGVMPIFVSVHVNESIDSQYILLGLFMYLAVVAHDYAHSIGENNVIEPNKVLNIKVLNDRGIAIFSMFLFMIATFLGAAFWYTTEKPMFFIIALANATVAILYLEIRLIKEPVNKRARSFYVLGFVYFLLPLFCLIIDRARLLL